MPSQVPRLKVPPRQIIRCPSQETVTHLYKARQLRRSQPLHHSPQQPRQDISYRPAGFPEEVHDELAGEDPARLGEAGREESSEQVE